MWRPGNRRRGEQRCQPWEEQCQVPGLAPNVQHRRVAHPIRAGLPSRTEHWPGYGDGQPHDNHARR
eukprot:6456878-Lingulodinium_polyedra.AAC.1